MDFNTRDMIMKKLLDAQENVRDYEMFSKRVDNKQVENAFRKFAEESGIQAKKLQELMNKFNKDLK